MEEMVSLLKVEVKVDHRRKTATIIDATSLEWAQVGQWRGCCIMDKRYEKLWLLYNG